MNVEISRTQLRFKRSYGKWLVANVGAAKMTLMKETRTGMVEVALPEPLAASPLFFQEFDVPQSGRIRLSAEDNLWSIWLYVKQCAGAPPIPGRQ